MEPVNSGVPILHHRVFSTRPGLGEVRWKDQLEETEVGQAVDRDDFLWELGGGEAIS